MGCVLDLGQDLRSRLKGRKEEIAETSCGEVEMTLPWSPG